jgi:hypothetical protein
MDMSGKLNRRAKQNVISIYVGADAQDKWCVILRPEQSDAYAGHEIGFAR